MRFFTLPTPLRPDDFGISFIKALPLDCLAGEGTRRGSALACRTTPDDVLNELFSAVHNSEVNGRPQGGAYARRVQVLGVGAGGDGYGCRRRLNGGALSPGGEEPSGLL